jgi:hypothetical protein
MEILDRPSNDNNISSHVNDIRLSRPLNCSWAIAEMAVEDNASTIAKAIVNGTAIAVFDGFFKNGQGTSAFIIEGAPGIIDGPPSAGCLVGVNVIPGETESQSAYRSELGGIAGVLEALHCIGVAYDITHGSAEIGLDGDQARQEAFGTLATRTE